MNSVDSSVLDATAPSGARTPCSASTHRGFVIPSLNCCPAASQLALPSSRSVIARNARADCSAELDAGLCASEAVAIATSNTVSRTRIAGKTLSSAVTMLGPEECIDGGTRDAPLRADLLALEV